MSDLSKTIQNLYQRFGDLDGISIECHKELVAIGVVNEAACAEIFLQGAQLSAYQPQGKDPVIFLSKECRFQSGLPLRGGIPICWPWFGSLEKNNTSIKSQFFDEFIAAAPAHGFVRDLDWELIDINIQGKTLTVLTFVCKVTPNTCKGWPFAAELTYSVSIGESLTAMLSIKNKSEHSFACTGALHTYLSVSDIAAVHVTGLNDRHYIDALDGWELKQQQGDVRIDREVDRIYQFDADTHAIALHDQFRTLSINSVGSASVVVWNPWVDKSKRLSQFADDEYNNMLCIETANAADDVIVLAPDQEHHLGVAIHG